MLLWLGLKKYSLSLTAATTICRRRTRSANLRREPFELSQRRPKSTHLDRLGVVGLSCKDVKRPLALLGVSVLHQRLHVRENLLRARSALVGRQIPLQWVKTTLDLLAKDVDLVEEGDDLRIER